MAHFARIDVDGVVIDVNVIVDSEILDENGVESEEIGKQLLAAHHNCSPDEWVQTSYTGSMRLRYAIIGGTYLRDDDVFIAARPRLSYVLDDNFEWRPPKRRPRKVGDWHWDEPSLSWIDISKLVNP